MVTHSMNCFERFLNLLIESEAERESLKHQYWNKPAVSVCTTTKIDDIRHNSAIFTPWYDMPDITSSQAYSGLRNSFWACRCMIKWAHYINLPVFNDEIHPQASTWATQSNLIDHDSRMHHSHHKGKLIRSMLKSALVSSHFLPVFGKSVIIISCSDSEHAHNKHRHTAALDIQQRFTVKAKIMRAKDLQWTGKHQEIWDTNYTFNK